MEFVLKILGIILGAMICGAGFRFISMPVDAMDSIASILPVFIGIVMIVSSVVRFVRWTQVKSAGSSDGLLFWEAVSGTILGVALLGSWGLRDALTFSLDVLMAVWAALLLLNSGVIRIARAVKMRRANEVLTELGSIRLNWVLEMVLGVLITVCGVISLCNPVLTLAGIGLLVGIDVVFYGVTMIVSCLVLY